MPAFKLNYFGGACGGKVGTGSTIEVSSEDVAAKVAADESKRTGYRVAFEEAQGFAEYLGRTWMDGEWVQWYRSAGEGS